MSLIIGFFMLSKLFLVTPQDDKYKVGQIWEYKTRKGEEKSRLTIVGVQKNKELGTTIINIYVEGLKIKNTKKSNKIQHLPFSKEAMDKSVTKLAGTTKKLPDYKEGYSQWQKSFANGKAGIFSITVKEAIDSIEETLSQGKKVE